MTDTTVRGSGRGPRPDGKTRARRERRERRARAAQPRRSLSIPLVSVGAVVAAVAAIVLLTSSRPASTVVPRASGGPVALVTPSAAVSETLADGMTLGQATAPVTLEIWSDYQCPFCGELARSYLPRLVPDFVEPGTVRIVAQDIAFLNRASTESTDAAIAAACAADQGRFWAFHDLLMWNQAGENEGAFAPARLEAMATKLALDRAAWNACRGAPATARALSDRTARADALGITSTPTLVINGQAIVGLPKTYDILAAVLRQAAPSGPAVR